MSITTFLKKKFGKKGGLSDFLLQRELAKEQFWWHPDPGGGGPDRILERRSDPPSGPVRGFPPIMARAGDGPAWTFSLPLHVRRRRSPDVSPAAYRRATCTATWSPSTGRVVVFPAHSLPIASRRVVAVE